MFWMLGKIILLAVVLIVFFTAGILYLNTHPPRYPGTAHPSDYRLDHESVAFATDDGILLRGWFLPAGDQESTSAVIICHGLGASKSDFVDLAAYFVNSGFHVLLFDFRAHGESSGRSCSLGRKEQKDLRAAVDFLENKRQPDIRTIGVYGFSLGAAVALLHTAKDERIQAVVADSSFSSLKRISAEVMKKAYFTPAFPFIHIGNIVYRVMFGGFMDEVMPKRYISEIAPRAVFLIAGDADEMIGMSHAHALFAAAGDPKTLWVIEGAPHGGTLMFAPDGYHTRVARFFMDSFQKESK